ncbi:MAG: (d)CMP kinase [Pseudomonadota bacterium]|nr:(d)CMP kinase [Pseudomonadota bacterium]
MSPVVTIDGPSGTGKGTIAELVAQRLGWHCLDSGALYRALGLAAQRRGLDLDAPEELAQLASRLRLEFRDSRVILDGEDVSEDIRTETAGNAASRVAAHPAVRDLLLDWQRAAARAPGLVADGRDMGSVVFPAAVLKIFLTARAEERAQRRHKQLKQKGLDVSLPQLVTEIRERDERDSNRSVAPLKAPPGALVVDTTSLSIEEVLDQVLEAVWCVIPDLAV